MTRALGFESRRVAWVRWLRRTSNSDETSLANCPQTSETARYWGQVADSLVDESAPANGNLTSATYQSAHENAFDLGSFRGGPVARSITLVEGELIVCVLTN